MLLPPYGTEFAANHFAIFVAHPLYPLYFNIIPHSCVTATSRTRTAPLLAFTMPSLFNKVKQSPSATTFTDPLALPPVLSGSSHHARSSLPKAAGSGSGASSSSSSKSSQRLFVIFAVALVSGAAFIFGTAAFSLSRSNFDDIQTAVELSIEEFKSISRKMKGATGAKGGAAKSFTGASTSSQSSVSNAAAPLAHLSCAKYGGPADKDAQEMVYWKDIESDRRYVSPFHVKVSAKQGQRRQYMTFEPDGTFSHLANVGSRGHSASQVGRKRYNSSFVLL